MSRKIPQITLALVNHVSEILYNSIEGGWKAAGAQMQSIFGSQVSGLGLGSTGSQSLMTNFMGGSAIGNNSNNLSNEMTSLFS